MAVTSDVLDSLLPLLHSDSPELHLNAAILEVADPAQLAELAADLRIRPYLLARVSDTAALVDPGNAAAVEAALLEAGHTPKILKGEWK